MKKLIGLTIISCIIAVFALFMSHDDYRILH